MKISERFIQALKGTGKPLHKIAWEVGIKPQALYKLSSGIDRPGPDDPRIIKLCSYLKIPVEYAFEDEPKAKEDAAA